MAALARTQSTTALQRLLRDPLGFVWRYALGWRSTRLEPEPLQLDPIAFGELVDEIISGAITRLEPRPGFARASQDEIETAIVAASATILTSWPLRRSVPPGILWRHTVKEAARRTTRGLASDEPTRADTRSWSEVPFGQDQPTAGELPWDARIRILLLRKQGSSTAAELIGSTSGRLATAFECPITKAQNLRQKTSALRLDKGANYSACSTRWRSGHCFRRPESLSRA